MTPEQKIERIKKLMRQHRADRPATRDRERDFRPGDSITGRVREFLDDLAAIVSD